MQSVVWGFAFLFFVLLSIRCSCCLRTAFLRLHSDGKGVALKDKSCPGDSTCGKDARTRWSPRPRSPGYARFTSSRANTPGSDREAAESRPGTLCYRRAGGTISVRAERARGATLQDTGPGPSPPLTPVAGRDVAPSARAQRTSAGSPTHTRTLKR